jgi:hypothetical protein
MILFQTAAVTVRAEKDLNGRVLSDPFGTTAVGSGDDILLALGRGAAPFEDLVEGAATADADILAIEGAGAAAG